MVRYYHKLVEELVGTYEERKCIEVALNHVMKGDSILLSAPPGYGKTALSYTLALESILNPQLIQRCIHVLPLRSIVEDVYDGASKLSFLSDDLIGKQMSGSSQTPWLQRKFVITTLDSFMLNFFLLPPKEVSKILSKKSGGHGILGRAAIYSALNVFDEVHLFLGENSKMLTTFLYFLREFSKNKLQLILMSATIPKTVEEKILSVLKPRIVRYGEKLRDKEFDDLKIESSKRIRWRVESFDGDSIKKIAEEVRALRENYDKILVVVNTVRRSIELSKELDDVITINGKLTPEDREKRLASIKRRKRWVCVSTQVVEAGLNISAQAMVSDVSPPSSLVQRVGRLIRSREDLESVSHAELIVVFDKRGVGFNVYDERMIEYTVDSLKGMKGKRFLWHYPINFGEEIGYEEFINSVPYYVKEDRYAKALLRHISIGAHTDVIGRVFELLNYSFVRDQPFIRGIVSDKVYDGMEASEFWEMAERRVLSLSKRDLEKMMRRGCLKVVSVRDYVKIHKRCEKDLEGILKDIVEKQYTILLPEELYDERYGLIL
ncbi:MAG: CRISPR-associated helicase Cas3' [Candidatus Asgardarchaeia archaeon]